MSTSEPESPVLKTPEWLEVLEKKRKRPHKLAHEIGAGAPCLICKDACSGLNLHFWRKLCIECKCKKEDHEIQEEEEYSQFEILFNAKKVKRTTLKFNAQNKLFDWIPPNVAPDLAVDYLKSIPQSKLPISNSEGARYRKQQLEKQVPLHDVDPNACSNLSDQEVKEFQKYLDNLKNNVIGQGRVLKFQGKMLKENLIQGNLTKMLASSEDFAGIKPQGAEILSQLSVNKVPEYNALSESLNTESYPAEVKQIKHSQPFHSVANSDSSYLILGKAEDKNFNSQHPFLKHEKNFMGPKPFHALSQGRAEHFSSKNPEKSQAEEPNSLGLKTPSSFLNKNFAVQDKQNNNAQEDNNCNIDFQLKGSVEKPSLLSNSDDSLILKGDDTHNPQQKPCNASVLKDSLGKFSELCVSSNEVPFVPVQESGLVYTPNKDNKNQSDELTFKKDFTGDPEDDTYNFPVPPSTCQQCFDILNFDDVVVQTERGGDLALWHAKCFVCETCKELLVDLMYFYHKGKVYCGRHYAEIMKIPRCFGCDELIFVNEYTIAEDQSYHVNHFCCFHCDLPLGGKQYIPKYNFPVCLDCYQVKYGKNCRTCNLPIAAGEQRVSWKDLDFHVSPECFHCAKCLKSLLGGKFVVKNDKLFCSKECVQTFLS